MESFDLYIFSFGIFPFDLCSVAARLAVIAELLLGLGLVSCLWRRTVNWCTTVLLTLFSAFLVWRLAVGDSDSCHCFGEIVDMSPGQSLVKNALFALLLGLSWKAEGWNWLKNKSLRLGLTLAVSAAVCVTVFAVRPASIWYKSRGSGSSLVTSLWEPVAASHHLDEGRQLVMFLSPLCEHCVHAMDKFDSMAKRHEIDSSRVHLVFMILAAKPEENPVLIDRFFENAVGGDPGLDWMELAPGDFIPITDGNMPLVCLFEDGKLLHEYGYSDMDERQLASFLAPDASAPLR